MLVFSHFLLFLLCCFSNSQSHFTRNLSSSSSSAIPVTVNHACTSELSADLGRSFSKRKKYGGSFHSWNSHLISSQYSSTVPASPYMDAAGRDGFLLLCQTHRFQKPLAVSGGWHSWIQSSLLLGFLQELHTPSILSMSGFSYIPNCCTTHGGVPTTAGSNLRSISHCTSQHSFIFTKYKTSLSVHRRRIPAATQSYKQDRGLATRKRCQPHSSMPQFPRQDFSLSPRLP